MSERYFSNAEGMYHHVQTAMYLLQAEGVGGKCLEPQRLYVP